MTNKDDGREVTLNGLNICKGEKFDEFKEVDYDKGQVEAKRVSLMKSVDEQLNEVEDLKKKIEAADRKTQAVETEYNQHIAKEQEMSGGEKLQAEQK